MKSSVQNTQGYPVGSITFIYEIEARVFWLKCNLGVYSSKPGTLIRLNPQIIFHAETRKAAPGPL